MMRYKALALVALLAASFAAGHKWSNLKWSERVANAESDQKTLVLELERAQKSAEYLLLESVNDILDEEDVKTEVVYREKIVYRDNPDAGNCKLPYQWLQVHDSSTGLPRVPRASANAKAQKGEVSDIDVLDVVVENYSMCRKELAKYAGLWAWAESVYNTRKQ